MHSMDEQPSGQMFNQQAEDDQLQRQEEPKEQLPPTPPAYPPGAATQPQPVIRPIATPETGWFHTQQNQPGHTGYVGQPGAPAPQVMGSSIPVQPGQPGQPAMPTMATFPGPGHMPQMTAPVPPQPKPHVSGLRTGTLLALLALLAVVFGVGLFAGWQFGRSANPSTGVFQPGTNSAVTVPELNGNNVDAVREAVISKVQPAVVQIDVVSASQHALGSGVIIDGRGYIVTNNHVVANASSIRVTLSDGTALSAQVVGTDPADDLAVIKITPPSSGLSVMTLGDSAQLHVGQEVLAIGSPLGNTETVTRGIVSALNRSISEGQNGATIPDAIQTDAPINPGNSGGALVDLRGNLVGIPTLNAIDTEFNTPANGLGFAIPSNRVKSIVQQLITTGHVTHTGRSILGIGVTTVDQNIAARQHLSTSSGALIQTVTADGPAATAGLQPGDVIIQVAGKTVHSTADLSQALLQHRPGETVQLKVYRGNQPITLSITLGELPAS